MEIKIEGAVMVRALRRLLPLSLVLTLLLPGCAKEETVSPSPTPPPVSESPTPPPPEPILNPDGDTLLARFRAPDGFTRVSAEEGSFEAYLQTLPLKTDGTPVLTFEGKESQAQNQAAIIDLDVGKKNAQSGSRALLRLRAEYLYAEEKFDEITYHFLSGFTFPFEKWAEGYRVRVDGKKVEWQKKAEPSTSYETFRAYLDTLYAYTNTTGILADLKPTTTPYIGDVFINAESGGVMIVDMAVNPQTQEKVFLLACSGSPAESIHVLKNPDEPELSPWYRMADGSFTTSGGGVFGLPDLRMFDEVSSAP